MHQSLPTLPDSSNAAAASGEANGKGGGGGAAASPGNAGGAGPGTGGAGSGSGGGRVLQRLSSIRNGSRRMFTSQLSTSKSESHACSQPDVAAEGTESLAALN